VTYVTWAHTHSKKIVKFIRDNFQIPTGNKSKDCRIPKIILNSNKKIRYAFLRGLADTDFSLMFKNKNGKIHNYPVIKISFRSKNLTEDITIILDEFKFGKILKEIYFDKRFNKFYKRYSIYIYGRSNLEKWMMLIGFNNQRQMTKYIIWEKLWYCPPNTTLMERKQILKNNISKVSEQS
jgi:intein/homing endonuclease